MKIWSILLSGMLMLFALQTWAQSTSETALLFSRTQTGGSARILGMGGVQTSLGGDFSSAYSNPAGLGMYNRSEIVFAPGFNTANLKSNYLGNSGTESKTNLNMPGFGIIFQTDQDDRNGFLSGTFAVSFTRTNNFNQNFTYQGVNDKNSIIDYFLEDATGFHPNTFTNTGENFNTPTGLAYNNYLIEDSTFWNSNASPLDYFSFLGTYSNPKDVREVFQLEDIKTTGTQNQWSFSYGANLNDKFFLGGGVGITAVRFQTKKIFSESDYYFVLDPSYSPLDNLVLEEELRISGSGINGTIGMIYRPMDQVQLGFSYRTPTLFKLTDSYHASMSTQWNNFDYFGNGSTLLNDVNEETDEVLTEYDLKTPSHINLGGTFFFQKSGFLSADIEIVNYSGANYSSGISGISFNSDNERIKSLYQTTINYRIGGEYRYQNFRFRLGAAYLSDPFSSKQNDISRKIISYSAGAGYRAEKFYFDIAWITTNGKTSYRPYRVNSEFSPLVAIQNNSSLVVVTLGFPF